MRFYGHRPDPIGHQVTSARVLVGGRSFPQAVFLDPMQVLDQGITSSCVGHGIAGAAYCSAPDLGELSPAGIYTLARCIDRAPFVADGEVPGLIDDGSMPNQAMRAIAEWGVCTREEWPLDEAGINAEPDLLRLEKAAGRKLSGYGISAVGEQRLRLFCSSIAAKMGIAFAIQTDGPFDQYTGGVVGGIVGKKTGDHMMYAYGYELVFANDGTVADIVIHGSNSWGGAWGESGRFRGNKFFLARMRDIYVIRRG